jgi:tRNA(fMet)-specific endonuclease VapC
VSYLIDTDVVADWLNNRPTAVRLLPTLEPEGLAISLVTYGEVYDGIYYGRDPRAAEQAFLRFLRGVTVLPLTRTIMKRFARIRGQLRHQGLTVQDPDLLIAATALTNGMTLVTRNLRHFQRIPDLMISTKT